MKARTPWFKIDVKPVYIGVYEVFCENLSIRYAYWNGWCWGWSAASKRVAYGVRNNTSIMLKKLAWRGLAKPPKGYK